MDAHARGGACSSLARRLACHDTRSGTAHGHTLALTAHGQSGRGALRMRSGSVGPYAIGWLSFASCFSQHSPLV